MHATTAIAPFASFPAQRPLEAPFWMVWGGHRLSGGLRYPSEEEALAEAERLAAAHPSETFFVFCSAHARRVG